MAERKKTKKKTKKKKRILAQLFAILLSHLIGLFVSASANCKNAIVKYAFCARMIHEFLAMRMLFLMEPPP